MSATVDENVATVAKWMRKASECNAELVISPEMMLVGYDAHLHEFFKETNWYGQVEEALKELSNVARETRIKALIGSPYPSDSGYLNALLLLQTGETPVLAGARTFLIEGWKKVWGFTEAEDRSPTHINGISFGSVFCAESSFLDRVEGRGLENSDVILWPAVSTSKKNECGQVIEDGCSEGAKSISQTFGVPVIQSNYVAQVSDIAEDRTLGGTVICNATGQIVKKASLTEEEMLFCDIEHTKDEAVVTPIDH